jgi:5-(carboxyamino)imidazole ribonucleotide synthase
MLGLAGVPTGVSFRFLDPSPDAGAAAVGELVIGELDDPDAVARAADGATAVTYEWEGVPASVVRPLVEAGIPVWPPPDALEASQDRLAEKRLFRSLGLPVADFAPVDTPSSMSTAFASVGPRAVLKTCRGGYDGKGQVVIGDETDLDGAFGRLVGASQLIMEQFVDFDRELSIIAARGRNGEVRCWPLVENHHRDGILRTSVAPAPGSAHLQRGAELAIGALMERFEYVGVLTLELFQVGERLFANEMAPRVHNSGHWTIEGAVTSQFENHVRAVLGWPLGSTAAVGVSAMVNSIGTLPDPEAVLGVEGVHLHCYGKSPRPGRKVGHATLVADDADRLGSRLEELRRALPADDG